MATVVFEDGRFVRLLPLVYARGTFDVQCGFDSLLAKIEAAHGPVESLFVRPELAAVMGVRQHRRVNQASVAPEQTWINGRLMVRGALDLPMESAAWRGETLLAARLRRETAAGLTPEAMLKPEALKQALDGVPRVDVPEQVATLIDYPWQLVHANDAELRRQFDSVGPAQDGDVHAGAHLLNARAIHIAPGARIRPGVVLDAEAGPIHVGRDVTIQSNATVIGPCHIGDGCLIQPNALLREAVSLGPVCKVGGEVEATIFQGYANKQHDGFVGHSFVGSWVNLGADTVTSDLKNTYGVIRVPINGAPVDTGERFVGAFIGDHAKTAIQTALPTGCVIGYAANVLARGAVPQFVPSFGWLTDAGCKTNDPQRAVEVARTVVGRRNRPFGPEEAALFLSVATEARMLERLDVGGH